MTVSAAVRLPSVTALRERATLESFAGPMTDFVEKPLANSGFGGSHHTLISVRDPDGTESTFVLKHTVLADDWTCRLSGGTRSREAALLEEDALADVWEIFSRPYLAFADRTDEAGFLMEDVTPFLFPDAPEPVSEAAEALMLGSLADLHARFMHDEAAALPWLATPAAYLSLLGPERVRDAPDTLPAQLSAVLPSGWKAALERVPPSVADLLQAPAAELERLWRGLPHTIVHGDVEVANFAIMPDARLCAFDWALMGWAPPSVDLGWYLAVNTARLAGSKEKLISDYRLALEERIAYRFADAVWDRLERHAVVTGARMLLWRKAKAVEIGKPGAAEEWEWWVQRLAAIA